MRTATPRAAASRSAPATTSRVSGPRLKSYCARSRERRAAPRSSATRRAISSGCWPPSVRVRISMEELISRLADATIGDTFNFYRDGSGAENRRRRLAVYLESRSEAPLLLVGEAAGYRGARVSGIPFTSDRQLPGEGPPEARRGKTKPQYTPHVDTGDFAVVVNAEKIAVTGKKLDDKLYYRHSGYPGGLRSRPLRDELERRPTEVLRKAVKGMLPRNRLSRAQIKKLKIYAGPEHPHEAQAPKELKLST